MSPWLQILIGWIAMAAVMAVLWLVQRRTGDAGIVDVAWGLGVGALAILFCAVNGGDETRRLVIALLAALWAIRLSAYVLRRVLTQPEDGRYQALKSTWGPEADTKMFRFYQLQAAGSVLFALPMLLGAMNTLPWRALDYLGILIWIISVVGETIADRQLDRFRRDPANRGKVCRDGLWYYSRHPNYFFEWLHWWSYVCLAWGGPWGWLTVLFPLAMWYFITRVTGIPPTEAQSLRSRGDAYREYQRTTSAFFPWPPKQASEPR